MNKKLIERKTARSMGSGWLGEWHGANLACGQPETAHYCYVPRATIQKARWHCTAENTTLVGDGVFDSGLQSQDMCSIDSRTWDLGASSFSSSASPTYSKLML